MWQRFKIYVHNLKLHWTDVVIMLAVMVIMLLMLL